MTLVEEIMQLFAGAGSAAYFGEPVTMLEHSLQTAYFAQQADAQAPLVVAALLHDIGHLIGNAPTDLADWHRDARHELIGGRWLSRRLPDEVAEPVRLHVPAKRYLCATDPAYRARLSDASVVTLNLQGGPMSLADVARFESEPFFAAAVSLRRWDDQGKIAGLSTPDLLHYRDLIDALPLRKK